MSKIGTPLPRPSPKWLWVAVFALLTAYLAWKALPTQGPWQFALLTGGLTLFGLLSPYLSKAQRETVQVDESGVLRVDGAVREAVAWDDIQEIRIITTNEGPYVEDVFFALGGPNGKGCLVPHDAAVRTKLLEELQARFPGLDNRAVVEAMGSTSNKTFIVWKRQHAA